MQMCEGVVVVVDREAIIFTRILCGFEQAMVIQGEQLLLDFATIHSGGVGLNITIANHVVFADR